MAKQLIGTVSSNKPDKTIVVTVVTRKTHPIYRKQYSVSTKFMAHDEKNECIVGDKVSIEETRPISARKRFILKEVISRPAIVQKKGEEEPIV
jgi:small subunit ribosomal protein S17